MKMKTGGECNLVSFGDISTTISIKRSRRELSIDMFIHRGIYQNKVLFLCFIHIPKTGVSFG